MKYIKIPRTSMEILPEHVSGMGVEWHGNLGDPYLLHVSGQKIPLPVPVENPEDAELYLASIKRALRGQEDFQPLPPGILRSLDVEDLTIEAIRKHRGAIEFSRKADRETEKLLQSVESRILTQSGRKRTKSSTTV